MREKMQNEQKMRRKKEREEERDWRDGGSGRR